MESGRGLSEWPLIGMATHNLEEQGSQKDAKTACQSSRPKDGVKDGAKDGDAKKTAMPPKKAKAGGRRRGGKHTTCASKSAGKEVLLPNWLAVVERKEVLEDLGSKERMREDWPLGPLPPLAVPPPPHHH
jgi:hypothetical protein